MDGTKPPFRPLAFILIDEVSVLKGNLFAAVFDFKDLTGVFFLVIDDHVKLASLKLQFENTVILVGRLHGFQQHNIFHHPAADFFKDAARDLRFVVFAER